LIIVDSSAWIEYFRGSGSPVNAEVRRLVDQGGPIATTELVILETLAGARDSNHALRLRRFLYTFDLAPTHGVSDYETAADIFHACRRAGSTIRSLIDCVIAAIAIREGAEVLHKDRDYDQIALHAGLRLAAVGAG